MSTLLSMNHPTARMTQSSHNCVFEKLKAFQTLLGERIYDFKEQPNMRLIDEITKVSAPNKRSFSVLPTCTFQPMNFHTPTSSPDSFSDDWLTRVKSQFDPQTPKKVKEVDAKHAKENLKKGRFFIATFPGMMAIEGAKNYFLNTIAAKSIKKLAPIADVQWDIDEKSLNKARGYRNAIFAGLVGTIAIGVGSISMTRFATASTIAVIAGKIISAIAVMYATYNCRLHWSDEEEGKRALSKVQSLIKKLLNIYEENPDLQLLKESQDKELQAITRQRGDPYDAYSRIDIFNV